MKNVQQWYGKWFPSLWKFLVPKEERTSEHDPQRALLGKAGTLWDITPPPQTFHSHPVTAETMYWSLRPKGVWSLIKDPK